MDRPRSATSGVAPNGPSPKCPLYACKQNAIPFPLQNGLRILSNPMFIAVGIFILCIDLYILITTILSEQLSADQLERANQYPP
jgi:hypothetical protein